MAKTPFESQGKNISAQKMPWTTWWTWALITLTIYLGLYIFEDELRTSNSAGADAVAICKLFLVCLWATVGWRSLKDTGSAGWTIAARAVLIVALGLAAMTL